MRNRRYDLSTNDNGDVVLIDGNERITFVLGDQSFKLNEEKILHSTSEIADWIRENLPNDVPEVRMESYQDLLDTDLLSDKQKRMLQDKYLNEQQKKIAAKIERVLLNELGSPATGSPVRPHNGSQFPPNVEIDEELNEEDNESRPAAEEPRPMTDEERYKAAQKAKKNRERLVKQSLVKEIKVNAATITEELKHAAQPKSIPAPKSKVVPNDMKLLAKAIKKASTKPVALAQTTPADILSAVSTDTPGAIPQIIKTIKQRSIEFNAAQLEEIQKMIEPILYRISLMNNKKDAFELLESFGKSIALSDQEQFAVIAAIIDRIFPLYQRYYNLTRREG